MKGTPGHPLQWLARVLPTTLPQPCFNCVGDWELSTLQTAHSPLASYCPLPTLCILCDGAGMTMAKWGWGFSSAPQQLRMGWGNQSTLSLHGGHDSALRNSVTPSGRGTHPGLRICFWSRLCNRHSFVPVSGPRSSTCKIGVWNKLFS